MLAKVNMKKSLIILWFLSMGTTVAMTVLTDNVKCPIDGEEFEFIAQASGSSFGSMLDGQPYGAIIMPWPIAKCPKDGMVMYKDFTEKEIILLRNFVESKEYQELQKKETNYWLAYILSKRLSAPIDEQVSLMQQATWEASKDERYERYAKETIKAIDGIKNPPKETIFLKGELYRRIGNFGNAKQVFSKLNKNVDDGSFLAMAISQELELIAKKNSSSRRTLGDDETELTVHDGFEGMFILAVPYFVIPVVTVLFVATLLLKLSGIVLKEKTPRANYVWAALVAYVLSALCGYIVVGLYLTEGHSQAAFLSTIGTLLAIMTLLLAIRARGAGRVLAIISGACLTLFWLPMFYGLA